MSREEHNQAAALLLGSSLLFASAGAAVKIVSATVPNEMVVFFRSFFGLLALLPWVARSGLGAIKTDYPRQHVTRALAGLCAMYCFFYAIAHLPLAEAMLLNYCSPLFIPFIARVWLGEPIPPGVGWAIVTGFLGISLILKPGLGLLAPAALIGLGSGMLTAVAMVSIRGLARHEPTPRIVFYFGAVCSTASAIPMLRSWSTPAPREWATLLVIGALATSGQLLLTRAYALAPAARIGPFTYSTVLFAALLGWLLWGEVPDGFSLAGGAMVFAAAVLAIQVMGPRAEAAPEEAIPEAGV